MVGEKIKQLIESQEHILSKEQVIEKLGMSLNTLYNIFKRTSVETKYLEMLSDIYNVPIAYFFEKQEVEPQAHVELSSQNEVNNSEKDKLLEYLQRENETLRRHNEDLRKYTEDLREDKNMLKGVFSEVLNKVNEVDDLKKKLSELILHFSLQNVTLPNTPPQNRTNPSNFKSVPQLQHKASKSEKYNFSIPFGEA